jgi:hypothetical protein
VHHLHVKLFLLLCAFLLLFLQKLGFLLFFEIVQVDFHLRHVNHVLELLEDTLFDTFEDLWASQVKGTLLKPGGLEKL